MKWHSLSISLILAAGVAVSHSSHGLAQTPRETVKRADCLMRVSGSRIAATWPKRRRSFVKL